MKPKRKVNWVELMALGFFHCAAWFMPPLTLWAECHASDQEPPDGGSEKCHLTGNTRVEVAKCPRYSSDHISISFSK